MLDRSLESLMVAARRRPLAVGVLTAILAAIGVVLVSRVSFDANILRLLPRQSPAVQSFRTFLEDFGSLDHLYVVFDSADLIGDHTDLIDAYVTALRAAPEIDAVDSQLLESDRDWSYLSDRVLFLIGPAGAADALQRLRPPRLDAELAHARDLLSLPSADVKTYVRQDPLGFLGILRTRLQQERGAMAFDPTQPGYVSRDGHSRLVIVKPRGAPFDSDFCKALFRRLGAVEAAARAAASSGGATSPVTIQAAGAYRVSLEAEAVIRHEGIVNSIGSLVLLLLIVLAVFRTPWMLLFAAVPLALAALLSLGLNGALRGTLSPATSGSAGMLFGLGIDGVVLLYARYLEARQAGAPPLEATRAMAGTASSVVLAQVTTVATFFALLVLDFPTLQDLGGLVGIGMLVVCPLTLVLLPALLPRLPTASGARGLSAPWLGRLVTRHSRAIVWISVAATVLLAVAARRLRIDTRIERLQAHTQGADLERDVAQRFSLPLDVLLVVNENAQLEPLIEADQRLGAELARRAPAITASGIGLLLPPAGVQTAVADAIRAAARPPILIERDIRQAGERVGFRPDTFLPFLARLPRLVDADQRITYDGLIAHGLDPIVSRFLVRRNGRYAAVTYLYPRDAGNVDLEALDRTVQDVDPRLQLTGLSVVNHDLVRRVPPEFLKGLAIGAIAVALILYAVFRTILHALLALLPTAIGFVWSAGLLALFGVELDLFSLFAIVTFIGIAVDYGIYVLYRYAATGGDLGDILTRTGAAISVACLTALAGFGTLINSTYGPLHTFGIVSVITLTCCAAAALLLLPSMLLQMTPWSRPTS